MEIYVDDEAKLTLHGLVQVLYSVGLFILSVFVLLVVINYTMYLAALY
jgi:hypothetical protein